MSLSKEFKTQGETLFRYRGYIPIIVLLAALVLHLYQLRNNITPDLVYNFSYQLFCLAVSILGLIIRICTLGFAKRNTSGRNTTKQIADSLNTSGMYSILRHPLYLGNFLMWLGVGLLIADCWFILFFILLFWIYYERIMYIEESFLIEKFGNEYTDWSSRVPAFIPHLSKWKSPKLSFNSKKVIRQEKSGIAALFIVFMVFHQVRYLFIENVPDLSFSFWNTACLVSVIYLLIVKIIQKKTSLLKG